MPAARRPPERGRMVEVANAGRTALGAAPFLRTVSLTPDSVSAMAIACKEWMYERLVMCARVSATLTDLLVRKARVFE